MTTGPSGWKLALTPVPAVAVEAMPKPLQTAVLRYLSALALEAGGAVEAGKPAPGRAMDDTGLRYSIVVQGEPVLVEYLVIHAARELRVTTVVWLG